jgi:hypothetical protein
VRRRPASSSIHPSALLLLLLLLSLQCTYKKKRIRETGWMYNLATRRGKTKK